MIIRPSTGPTLDRAHKPLLTNPALRTQYKSALNTRRCPDRIYSDIGQFRGILCKVLWVGWCF